MVAAEGARGAVEVRLNRDGSPRSVWRVGDYLRGASRHRRPSREEGHMDNDRYARYGAATGIIAVILILVGFFIFGSDLPDTAASAQDWGSFFTAHQSRI